MPPILVQGQSSGGSRYAPYNFRKKSGKPGETTYQGAACDFRLPNSADEFEFLYGKDDLDAFIEQYIDEYPRDFDRCGYEMYDLGPGEVVIQLKRVFHMVRIFNPSSSVMILTFTAAYSLAARADHVAVAAHPGCHMLHAGSRTGFLQWFPAPGPQESLDYCCGSENELLRIHQRRLSP